MCGDSVSLPLLLLINHHPHLPSSFSPTKQNHNHQTPLFPFNSLSLSLFYTNIISLSNGNHFLQLLHLLFLSSLPIPTSPPSSPLFTSNLHHHHPTLHHPHFKPLHSLSHHFHHLSQTSHHHPLHLKRWRKRRHRR